MIEFSQTEEFATNKGWTDGLELYLLVRTTQDHDKEDR